MHDSSLPHRARGRPMMLIGDRTPMGCPGPCPQVTESSTVVLATPHPAEWKLAQHLVRFPDALRMAVRDLLPNGA